jgi:large subunit ribosomal protein L24
VMEIITDENRAVVSGVNVAKRHTKAQGANEGGIINKLLPIHISNLALLDPKDGKATRVGYKTLDGGKKVRVAKRTGATIDG